MLNLARRLNAAALEELDPILAFALPAGLSYQQVCDRIAAALQEQGIKDAWVRDLFEDRVVYCVSGVSAAKYYQRGYSLSGDEVTFTGDPQEVAERRTYEAVAESYSEIEAFQVFIDDAGIFASDDGKAPKRIPFLPKPGKYKHPTYGEIDLTRESNQERVDSIKKHVYQEHVPLDAEHQTKLSGAVGYIRDMHMNEDGSADAEIEWSARGETLVASGGFRYVSPEWFRTWRDPATGEEHKNVIAGGAITTRPFFKEKALRALVASERGVEVIDAKEFGDFTPEKRDKGLNPEQKETITMAEPEDTTFTAAEIEAKIEAAKTAAVAEVTASFTERITAAETEAANAKTERDTLATSVATLEKSARTARFTALVTGQGGATDGAPWAGDPTVHVEMLEALAGKFGEEDPLFVKYVEQQNAAAVQLKEANLFSEVGTARSAVSSDPEKRLDALAQERMKTHEAESFEQAYAEVVKTSEGSKLYAQIPTIRGQ